MLAAILLTSSLGATRVVPGVSLGQIKIGAPGTTLARLGRPYGGDAAMQKAWSTWLGKGSARLDVHTAVLRDRPIVRVVRATSTSFRTTGGLGPGTSEAMWRRAYPGARDLGTYRPPSGGPPVHLFDDVRRGLAFEVQRGQCVAVAVHARGSRVDSSGLIPYVSQSIPRP